MKREHVPVAQWKLDLCEKYGPLLTNTGGNDPADLLLDLQPYTDGGPNRIASTNIVRFTLAVAVSSQINLLRELEDREILT